LAGQLFGLHPQRRVEHQRARLGDAALGQQQLTHNLVVGGVLTETVGQPALKLDGAAVTGQVDAVGQQKPSPYGGQVRGVVVPVEQFVEQTHAAVRLSVVDERVDLTHLRDPTRQVEVNPPQILAVGGHLGRTNAALLPAGGQQFVDAARHLFVTRNRRRRPVIRAICCRTASRGNLCISRGIARIQTLGHRFDNGFLVVRVLEERLFSGLRRGRHLATCPVVHLVVRPVAHLVI
jgi:hypothetical protein